LTAGLLTAFFTSYTTFLTSLGGLTFGGLTLGGLTDLAIGLGCSLTGSGLVLVDVARTGFEIFSTGLGSALTGLGSTFAGVALTTSALAGVTVLTGDFLGVGFLTDFGFSILAGVGFFSYCFLGFGGDRPRFMSS
jgi:hypothetical protein